MTVTWSLRRPANSARKLSAFLSVALRPTQTSGFPIACRSRRGQRVLCPGRTLVGVDLIEQDHSRCRSADTERWMLIRRRKLAVERLCGGEEEVGRVRCGP